MRSPGHVKHVFRYYCKPCFRKEFPICLKCGGKLAANELYKVLPNGGIICDECYGNEYATCHHCGDVITIGQSREIDGDDYCDSCVERYFVECEGCNAFIRTRDGIQEENGDWYCQECHDEREHDDDEQAWKKNVQNFSVSQREFTDSDVLAIFPGIKERLARVFDRSAKHRSIDARQALKSLKALLPSVHFNDDFTYINPIGVTKELRDLASTKNSIFKSLGITVQLTLTNEISEINNVRRDINALIMNEKVQAIDNMMKAIKCRMYIDKHYPRITSVMKSIEGTYPYPDKKSKKLLFIITRDPVAIIAKSTSQCWESMSCEKVIRGEYGYGAFSDIANSNAVCYIFEKNLPIARIMIRWCEVRGGNVDLGIEEKWYYCREYPDKAEDFAHMGRSTYKTDDRGQFIGGFVPADASKFLVSILNSKGLHENYSSCKTPYKYMGYSDTAGEGHTRIDYRR